MEWKPTQFGSAETFVREGVFYSHDFTGKGWSDVYDAGRDYILQMTEGRVQRLALTLLEIGQDIVVDQYYREPNLRWKFDVEYLIDNAKRLDKAAG